MYGKIFKTWLSIVVICIIGLFCVSIIVDPIDILEMPIWKGINNCKIKQNSYLDVFKPYQVIDKDYKVIFIGTSRVYVGMRPSLEKYKDEEVYNFGCSSLSLVNMEKYLDYLYHVQNLEKVYLGLDLFQFSDKWYKFSPESFAQDRLDRIITIRSFSKAEWIKRIFASLEHLRLQDVLIPTIKYSSDNPNGFKRFIRGWDKDRGESNNVNIKEYYSSLNSYMKTYKEYTSEEETMLILSRIYENARDNDVELIVFFNPISVDLQALIYLYGLDSELEKIKCNVTKIFGTVYDFNFVNNYTTNRQEYFYDASHYNCKFGELVKKDIEQDDVNERMYILRNNDIESQLSSQRTLKQLWLDSNSEYLNSMKIRLTKGKIEAADFKFFVGF